MINNQKKAKVGFVSLGCPKNRVDTEIMLGKVLEAGYELTAEETEADIVIINTCAFIESAKKESIDNILDIAWLKQNRNLKAIIVTGCLSERYREQIFEELPEVDAVLGVGSFDKIVEAIENVDLGKKYSAFDDNNSAVHSGERILTTPNYSAYLKVAEGCNNNCTYCAIPLIRGKFRSRYIEDILDEAKALERSGVKEINLIAQDTTRYGEDIYGKFMLTELIQRLTKETSIPWIRILYCYPNKITDELIAEIRDNPRVVKYIDLPIQHISNNILKKMNRHGDKNLIYSVINKLRKEVPGIAIRSTAIVGFPGETEEDFSELCEFVKEVKFERFGAFTYSREEDTAAFDMPDQIDEQTKQDRYDLLMTLQLDISNTFNKSKIGSEIEVLCEGFDVVAETYFGRSYADAPDIDTKVYFSAKRRVKEGEFVKVKINDALDYDLIGEVVS